MTLKKKIRVGVIYGGKSGEHEVSIVSARSVMSMLNKKHYSIIPFFIDKNPYSIILARILKTFGQIGRILTKSYVTLNSKILIHIMHMLNRAESYMNSYLKK